MTGEFVRVEAKQERRRTLWAAGISLMTWRASSKPSCVLPSLSNALARASYSLAESGASEMACARNGSVASLACEPKRTEGEAKAYARKELDRRFVRRGAVRCNPGRVQRAGRLHLPALCGPNRRRQAGDALSKPVEQGSEPSLEAIAVAASNKAESGGRAVGRGEHPVSIVRPLSKRKVTGASRFQPASLRKHGHVSCERR
jgi:hypothetical protein